MRNRANGSRRKFSTKAAFGSAFGKKVAPVATQASSDRADLACETAMEMQNTEKQHGKHDAGLMLAYEMCCQEPKLDLGLRSQR